MGSIALLGAGNVGKAIGGHMALLGHDVRIFSRWQRDLEPIAVNDGVDLIGEVEGRGHPKTLTTSIDEAVTGADVVVIAAPAFAHAYLSNELARVIEPRQLVLFQPGVLGSAVELLRLLRDSGRSRCLVAESSSSLYTCRLRGPATVYVGAIKDAVRVAAIPSSETGTVLSMLQEFFAAGFITGTDALAVGMFNSNPVYHVPPSILNFKTVENAESNPLHTLVTKRIGNVIDAIDRERVSLAHALGVHSETFWEFLAAAYGVVSGDFADRILQGYGRQAFPEPDSVNHRYFTEDIPFGLVTWSSFAHEAGLSLPLVDAFISLGSALCERDFVAEGRTAASLGLQGAGYEGIRRAFIDGEL